MFEAAVKTCARCETPKPMTAFGADSRYSDGLQSYCKGCMRKASTESSRRRALLEVEPPTEKRCSTCGMTKPADRFYRQRAMKDGLHSYCKDCTRTYARRRYQQHPRGQQARSRSAWAATADDRQAVRRMVIEHYGGSCACCGETTFEFLAIDHINSDGAEHRRTIKRRGYGFLLWIIENGFPKELQVLCHNCNTAKSAYGICPHQVAETAVLQGENAMSTRVVE